MASEQDRRKQRLRKTKAELVDELEAMERTLSGLEAIERTGPERGVSWRFRALMDNAPTAIFLRDVEGRYILVNKAYEDLYGVDGRKVVGKMPDAVFAPESVGFVMDIHREVLDKKCRIDRETEVTVKDGSKRAQWATVFPLRAPDGVMIGVCGVLTDLADTKRAEREARVSQERLLAAIDSMQEAFCLYDADDRLIAANEKYLQIRPATKEILERGGSFEDLVRANVTMGIFADTEGREEEFIRQRLEWHRNLKGPFVQKDSDGTWWMLNETRTPEGGTAISLVDITQLKDAEAALRDSEERFRQIVEQAADAFFVHDLDGKLLDVSRKACESLGYSRNELLGLSIADIDIGIDVEAFKARLRKMRLGTPATFNGIHRRKNGTTFPVEISANIFMRDDEPVTVALVRDVTDRRRAEEARDQLAQAVENVPIGIALFDPDDRLVFFNGQYGELMEAIRDVLVPGTSFEDILRAAVKKTPAAEAIGHEDEYIEERMARHRNPSGPIEFRRQDKWLHLTETRLPDGSTFVLMSDMTEQRRMEEALRKSDALFRAVVNHSSHKIHIKDVDGRYVLINKEAERLFGVTDEEGRGKNSYDLFNKEMADAFVAHDRAVMESGIPTEAEETFTLEDGEHTFLTVKFPIYDLDGVAGVGAIGTDITDRKQAEAKLLASEQRFKELAESSSDWLWEMDADLRFTYFSDRYPEMTGIRIEDRIGTHRTDHLPDLEREDRKEKWEAHLADLEARRPFRNFEYVARAADGSLRWRRINGNPIFDSEGNFLGYRGTGTNITARKHAEEALKESQARLANILDNSPAPIYFKDRDGRFLIANRRFQELYDVEFDEIQGRTSKEIFGAGLGEAFYGHDKEVLETRKVIEKEENIFGRTYLTLKFPIVDATGELLGLGGIETDVTELKQVESELRAAKEDAEFANRAKTEFLANMSHELRTPLNSILGFSEILMSETFGPLGNDLYKEYAGDIHDSGSHLLALISEVLDLSKLEAGELEIFESEIDVPDVINTCVKMVESRHSGNQAAVSAKFSNGLPQFQGDERRFKQIMLNLLGNAVKFTPPTGEITVSAGICSMGGFTIKVADSGIGIATEDIPKVLEPFGQVRDVLTRDHEGTGLGLYLAKSFTEMHGGTLDIESDVGRGTTVTLRFPKERTLAVN